MLLFLSICLMHIFLIDDCNVGVLCSTSYKPLPTVPKPKRPMVSCVLFAMRFLLHEFFYYTNYYKLHELEAFNNVLKYKSATPLKLSYALKLGTKSFFACLIFSNACSRSEIRSSTS